MSDLLIKKSYTYLCTRDIGCCACHAIYIFIKNIRNFDRNMKGETKEMLEVMHIRI